MKYRAVFTAISRLLNVFFAFITQLVITPFILTGLGQYLYGIFSLLNKAEGYMSFVDLRPSAILRYKLAILQAKNEIPEKNKYVGAAIYISLLTFPVLLLIGAILCYLFPFIFKLSNEYINISRQAVFLVAVFLGFKSFLGIPEAILRGNNLEYKGMFIEPLRNITYIGLAYVVIKLNYGLIGLITVSFISFLIAFLLKLIIQKRELPEYKILKPEKKHVVELSQKGGWYLFSSFSFQLLQTLDVIIIGIFFSPVLVTVFSLTKSLSFRISEAVITLQGSVGAGISTLISKNDIDGLRKIRLLLFRINLLISTTVLVYFLLFNKAFVSLWVGESNFSGYIVNLLICLTIPFIIFSMSSQLFVDAYLEFKQKSLAVFISSILTITLAIIFVRYWGLGGIALAILLGRIMLNLFFELLVNRHLHRSSFFSNKFLKDNIFLIILCIIALLVGIIEPPFVAHSWIEFINLSAAYFAIIIAMTFVFVIKRSEKIMLYQRIKRLLKSY